MKKQVVFYGAGKYLKDNWDTLTAKYVPIYICDADVAKQNTGYFGIPILSPEEVKKCLPNVDYIVTLSSDNLVHNNKLDAIDSLIKKYGVSSNHILNYENYYYGKGCPHTAHSIFFQNDRLQNCCENPVTPNVPFCDLDGEDLLNRLIMMKKKTQETIRNMNDGLDLEADVSEHYVKSDVRWLYDPKNNDKDIFRNPMCYRCRYVKEGFYSLDYFLIKGMQISSNSDSRCNFKCPYCCEAMPGYKPINGGGH